MKITLILEGLNCASCAGKIETAVSKMDGVDNVTIDFVSKKLKLSINNGNEEFIIKDIKNLVNELEPDVLVLDEKDERAKHVKNNTSTCDGICPVDENMDNHSEAIEDHHDHGDIDKSQIKKIILAAILLLIPTLFKLESTVSFIIYLLSYLVVGFDIIKRAFKNILKGQAFDEHFLMTIATAGAFIIGEYPEGVMVMLLYQVGEYLQGLAVNKSRDSISKLMDIRPEYANLYREGSIEIVDPSEVTIGDIIIVKPGEKIPLDGIVLEGESYIDNSNITGESKPSRMYEGKEILSGAVNGEGLLKIKVKSEFKDSTVAKVLDLVENASSKKAPTEKFITKFAKYYTPIVVLVAFIIGFIIPILFKYNLSDWAYRSFVFLVISCPCALVISVPLGFFGGIGAASKEGILIKGGNYLDALNDIDTIVFDKTGTITEGSFKVSNIYRTSKYTEKELLEIAALGEYYSNHPIGKSILESYEHSVDEDRISDYEELSGKGIRVKIDEKEVLLGNEKLLTSEKIEFEEIKEIGTIVYIAMEKEHIGTIIVSDKLKEGIIEDIKTLKKMGIKKTIMLSGDNADIVEEVALLVGIDKAYGNLLPQDKVEKFEEIMESNLNKVAFVGDGVNDAPALARSDIGISMGGLGSDAAIEASDIVIMTDEISKISSAIKIAKKTKKIVLQNIYLALGVKLIVLLLGALGEVNMWMAIFADVGVSILAIFNSIRALKVED